MRQLANLVILYISTCNIVFAQDKPYREPKGTNNWFIELGGSGLFYSFNYEKFLATNNHIGWIGRIGAAYNPVDYLLLNKVDLRGGTVLIPFTTSIIWGERKERLELGGGFTLAAQGILERETIYTAIIGFRIIEMNKVYFRVSYTPLIRNSEYIHWFGVSLGRNFSTK
jgi:hypothetical protein